MELLIKALVIGIASTLLALAIRQTVPGVSLSLGLAASALILLLVMAALDPLLQFLREVIALCDVSGVYTGPILKCMAISILCTAGASLCRDAGQASAAAGIELAGVAGALYAALPLLNTFLHMIGEML